ncbi:MAG TPA: hypothetical protein EYG70_03240 [Sulfurimonas sp.]|nr:hypothetical protein [Sulfurimonas sp.]
MKKTLLTLLTATMLMTGITTTLSASQGTKSSKPFLIQGKLPHLTMMVKILWDDEDLALSKEQKTKLLKIRQHTMGTAKALNLQIVKLENEVVKRSKQGMKPSSLKTLVEDIAALRLEATMVHLECIYNTRAILSEDQLYVLE